MDRGQIGPEKVFISMLQPGASVVQLSLFFFGSCHVDGPLGIDGPVARWRLEKNAWPFFFLVPWPMSFPVCANEKKTKIKKKAAKKKSCYINIKKKKSPFPFFLYGL